MSWDKLAGVADYSLGGAPDCSIKDLLLTATLSMKVQDYPTAAKVLTGAIHEQLSEPQGFMLYDLRVACCLHTGQVEQALDDAIYCTKLNPEWPRGWARLGAAQLCMGHYRAAVSAYKKAIEIEGGSGSREMQLGLQLAAEALAGQGADRRAAMHDQ